MDIMRWVKLTKDVKSKDELTDLIENIYNQVIEDFDLKNIDIISETSTTKEDIITAYEVDHNILLDEELLIRWFILIIINAVVDKFEHEYL